MWRTWKVEEAHWIWLFEEVACHVPFIDDFLELYVSRISRYLRVSICSIFGCKRLFWWLDNGLRMGDSMAWGLSLFGSATAMRLLLDEPNPVIAASMALRLVGDTIPRLSWISSTRKQHKSITHPFSSLRPLQCGRKPQLTLLSSLNPSMELTQSIAILSSHFDIFVDALGHKFQLR